MIASNIISIGSTVVTLGSVAVTIFYASKASKHSESAKKARDSAQLNAIADRLKSAQDHIRDVAPEKLKKRGYDYSRRVDSIRRDFDASLSALPHAGLSKEARSRLKSAQATLNVYQTSLTSVPDQQAWEKLQVELQDTISDLLSQSIEGSSST